MLQGPEIGPVRADFTHQECAPPPPPPREDRPRCLSLQGLGKCSSGASVGPSQHCRVSRRLHRLPGRGQDSGRIPCSASGRAATGALQGQAGDPKPAQGLAPGSSARSPAPSTRGGAFPIRFPNPFPSRGGARGQRSCQRASVRNGSCPCPAPRSNLRCPPVPSTPQRGVGRRVAGEQAHLPETAAETAGSTEEVASDPPRRLSAGAGGMERRGPDGCFPQLLRSSVLTAIPGNQCLNCHSPPLSTPAVSASSSHSFLPPPSRPVPRPAPPRPPRSPSAVRHGVTPTGPPRSAMGGGRSLAHVFPAPAQEHSKRRPGCLGARPLNLSPAQSRQRNILPLWPSGLGPEPAGLGGRCFLQKRVGLFPR